MKMFSYFVIHLLVCSTHMNINIDMAVKGILGVFSVVTGRLPQFRINGGSHRENLALQNVQVSLTRILSAAPSLTVCQDHNTFCLFSLTITPYSLLVVSVTRL